MKAKIGRYLKGSASRRIDIKIDKYDSWSLDHTLALIILPALIQLKIEKSGVPSEFVDVGGADHDSQLSFDFYKESHDAAFEQGCEKWNEVLDKMIWSFQQLALEDYDSQYHHGKMEIDWVKTDEQMYNPINNKMEDTYQMVDKNPGEHWYDHVGHMLHEERIQEGLELFGKYYRSLWD
jgi:hypothetical protein